MSEKEKQACEYCRAKAMTPIAMKDGVTVFADGGALHLSVAYKVMGEWGSSFMTIPVRCCPMCGRRLL